MRLTRDVVLHVAKLARLSLTEEEVTRMVQDLGRILGAVEELSALDTSGVEPTAGLEGATAPLRADEPTPGVATDRALAEAPRADEGGFAVPGFVDER